MIGVSLHVPKGMGENWMSNLKNVLKRQLIVNEYNITIKKTRNTEPNPDGNLVTVTVKTRTWPGRSPPLINPHPDPG